ncbi:hypothetical protein [Psychrobacter sp. W2-37-MNA-CIBAN-0211]|uniref:hypothetical protein n=1 Tax=Psychrobacter sp. W2-37-MNA-CIBAN-0211 TaxID=3140443 RepID=UPI0033346B2E
MIKRFDRADVEKLSLEFAKEMIDFSDDGSNAMIEDHLIKRATNMAIAWLEGEDLRSKMFEQQCANWIDLAEVDISSLNLESYKKYWFIAREHGSTNPLELIHGKFIKPVESKLVDAGKYNKYYASFADIQDDRGNNYIAQYIIPAEDGAIFNQDFEPLAPKGVVVKNKSFSSTIHIQPKH